MLSYVYGKNVGNRLLAGGQTIHKIFLTSPTFSGEIKTLILKRRLDYELVDNKYLDRLCPGANHQGLVLVIPQYPTYSLPQLVAGVPPGQWGLLVMLDGIVDPHNLGAILRTCEAVGGHGVIIPKHRAVSLNSTVAKVSSGAIDTVKVAEITNLRQGLDYLKTQGYWIVGTVPQGPSLYDRPYDTPVVLVIGSEGKGISRLVKENCDYLVSIPMQGQIGSLNAAVAAGIILYQIRHQRSLRQAKDGTYESIRK